MPGTACQSLTQCTAASSGNVSTVRTAPSATTSLPTHSSEPITPSPPLCFSHTSNAPFLARPGWRQTIIIVLRQMAPTFIPPKLAPQHSPPEMQSDKATSESPIEAVPAADLSLASLTPLSLSLASGSGPPVTLQEQHIGTLLGSIVWPGGRYLAQYLHHMHTALPTLLPSQSASSAPPARVCPHFSLPHSFLRGKRVIELGSGTGIVGIIAARCNPSTLVLTDLPALIPLLTTNIQSNTQPTTPTTTAIHCLPLTWSTSLTPTLLTHPILRTPFHYMLLSDVVYDAYDVRQVDGIDNHRRLFYTVHCFGLVSVELVILLTYTARREEEGVFFGLLREYGYCWTVKRADEVVPGCVDVEDRRVDIYVIWRNESVSGEMHKHVKDRRLSAWVTEERSRQDEQLQQKLQARKQRQKA